MITQNYCASVGSLVHRVQGYKKLKEDDLMASQFYLPTSTAKNRSYYVVSESFPTRIKSTNLDDFLKKGSLVFSVKPIRNPVNDIEVKVVDVNNKNNVHEGIVYCCPPEKLIRVNEKVWNLIATIESASDKIKIAKDNALCEELCSIEVGTFVIVFSSCVGTVTAKRSLKNGIGVLFEVLIEKFFENERNFWMKTGEKITVTCENLRPCQTPNRTSSKLRFQNDLHSTNNRYSYDSTDETDFVSQNHSIPKFKSGDSVMWLSESNPQAAMICWNNRINDHARIHLNKECQLTKCDRSTTISVPTRQLMLTEDYRSNFSLL